MCQFMNCKERETYVSVIYRGDKACFCSVEHAALWLLTQEHPLATRIVVMEDERSYDQN